jgi:two-component system response regulator (stage 0 sporulation protein A)
VLTNNTFRGGKTMKNLTSDAMIMEELQSIKTLLIQQNEFLQSLGFEAAQELAPTSEITYTEPEPVKPIENFDYKITTLLKELGIPANVKGYNFLRYGIKLVYQDEKYLTVTKFLYPEVAKKFNSTYGKVERAIRYAIEISWGKHKFHPFYTYYQVKPTNAQFLADLVDHFKLEEDTQMSAMKQNYEALKMLADS